jgi:DNA-binding beta-propeller fold protein YncE
VVGLGPRAATDVVTPIDVGTEQALRPISFRKLGAAFDVAVTPDGGTAYVAVVRSVSRSDSLNYLVPIDVSTNKALAPIALRMPARGQFILSYGLAAGGRMAYVLTPDYVIPVDLATRTELKPIAVPTSAGASDIAVDPDGQAAFVISYDPNEITPVDLATRTVLAPIRFGNDSPDFVTFIRSGRTALVGLAAANAKSGKLVAIQALTGKVGKAVQLGSAPTSMVLTP